MAALVRPNPKGSMTSKISHSLAWQAAWGVGQRFKNSKANGMAIFPVKNTQTIKKYKRIRNTSNTTLLSTQERNKLCNWIARTHHLYYLEILWK